MCNVKHIIQETEMRICKYSEALMNRGRAAGEVEIFVVSNVKWNRSVLFRL